MERSTEVDFQYILQQKKNPKTNHFVISIIVMIEKCRNDLIEHYAKVQAVFVALSCESFGVVNC